MTTHRWLISIVLLQVLVACDWQQPAFPELRGPEQPSSLPEQPLRTPPAAYGATEPQGLAILLTETESSWLGLAHGLKSVGVPFRVTLDPAEALRHRVVVVYPSLTGSNVEPAVLRSLASHVRAGKSLLAFNVFGGGMPAVFGFQDTIEHRSRIQMEFVTSAATADFNVSAEEALIPLAPQQAPDSGLPAVSYDSPVNEPLAIFTDGSAALIHQSFRSENGLGHAYAVGLDFGHFILRAQNGRFNSSNRAYVNDYLPAVDTLLRFLRKVYREGDDGAVTLYTVPHNKEFTALVTHDVDYTQSLLNAEAYARSEAGSGVTATYFIQTKYVTDYNDRLFFDSSRIPLLQGLKELNVEFASHSVSHSNEFRNMPLGSGFEYYPEYRPFVQDFATARSGTVLGELRVSKFLLEKTTGEVIKAFRPGHLSLPAALPQALDVTGYRYSSSITANEALTHLPYQLMYNREYSAEVNVYEFPVTIEDEAGVLGDRLPEAIELAEKIGRHGGLVNLLIHTDITGHKLDFQERFIAHFQDRAHFSGFNEFARWWAIRDRVTIESAFD